MEGKYRAIAPKSGVAPIKEEFIEEPTRANDRMTNAPVAAQAQPVTQDPTQLDSWKQVHAHLTKAILAARESVQAKKRQRRFWLETICANLSKDGKLTQRSTWQRPNAQDLRQYMKLTKRKTKAKAVPKAATAAVLKGKKRKAKDAEKPTPSKRARPSSTSKNMKMSRPTKAKTTPMRPLESKPTETASHSAAFQLVALNDDSDDSDLSDSDVNVAEAVQDSDGSDGNGRSSEDVDSVEESVDVDDDQSMASDDNDDEPPSGSDSAREMEDASAGDGGNAEEAGSKWGFSQSAHPYIAAASHHSQSGLDNERIYSTYNTSTAGDDDNAESSESEDPF
jgi:hypothetical protein